MLHAHLTKSLPGVKGFCKKMLPFPHRRGFAGSGRRTATSGAGVPPKTRRRSAVGSLPFLLYSFREARAGVRENAPARQRRQRSTPHPPPPWHLRAEGRGPRSSGTGDLSSLNFGIFMDRCIADNVGPVRHIPEDPLCCGWERRESRVVLSVVVSRSRSGNGPWRWPHGAEAYPHAPDDLCPRRLLRRAVPCCLGPGASRDA